MEGIKSARLRWWMQERGGQSGNRRSKQSGSGLLQKGKSGGRTGMRCLWSLWQSYAVGDVSPSVRASHTASSRLMQSNSRGGREPLACTQSRERNAPAQPRCC